MPTPGPRTRARGTALWMNARSACFVTTRWRACEMLRLSGRMMPSKHQHDGGDGADVARSGARDRRGWRTRRASGTRLADLQASAIAVAVGAATLDVRLPARRAQLLADGIEARGVRRADAQIERAVAERDALDDGGRAPRCARSRSADNAGSNAPSPPPPRTSASRVSTRRRALVAFFWPGMATRNASWMPASSVASLLLQARELEIARAEVQEQQRGGEHRGDAPGAPALLQRRGDRERALQQIHGVAGGRGRREHAERTRRQQLHLHAGEALAQRVDLVLVGLPLVVAGVQQQPERRGFESRDRRRPGRRAPCRWRR